MKKALPLLFAAVFITIAAVHTNAQSDNAQKLINTSRLLETKPFEERAKALRAAAMSYVLETDEVSVVICPAVLGGTMDKKNKYSSELLAQYTFGMAAFKLANPDRKDDENAAQLAGVESMLRAYEAMVAEKPKVKYKGVDSLVEMRDKGELAGMIEEAACKGSSK